MTVGVPASPASFTFLPPPRQSRTTSGSASSLGAFASEAGQSSTPAAALRSASSPADAPDGSAPPPNVGLVLGSSEPPQAESSRVASSAAARAVIPGPPGKREHLLSSPNDRGGASGFLGWVTRVPAW